MANINCTVSLRTVAWWAVTMEGSMRASSVHRTQTDAVRAARDELLSAGGGELTVLDVNGNVEVKDVVAINDVRLPEEMRKSA